MNTRKHIQALRLQPQPQPQGASLRPSVMRLAASEGVEHAAAPANPACVLGSDQRCEHALTDAELNAKLHAYEQAVRQRFAGIVGVLKTLSARQHELDFAPWASAFAKQQLGYALPANLLDHAWVGGLDLRRLYSYCIFSSLKQCMDKAAAEQSAWRTRLPIDAEFLRLCGYHTVDISPCADGRLQGLVPFILRMSPTPEIYTKAYAGALFDIESDMADWAHREVERLSGAMADGEGLNYLKIAVYHFSSSLPSEHGCAAHGSDDRLATQAALARLKDLRSAIDRTYGAGAAPDVLLIGVDTDLDALRIHLPDGRGDLHANRYVETAAIYRQTLGLPAELAQARVAQIIADAERAQGPAQGQGAMHDGLRRLVLALAQANLSQIEYVIHYHAGRYAVVGHDEECIVIGETPSSLQLRNLFYFAHLDTVEEGAADLDVGIRIFRSLNCLQGLPVPVLVHFSYDARVAGSQARAVDRARRVRDAVARRYPDLVRDGLVYFQVAVSDRHGDASCVFVSEESDDATH
jgi:carboxysome shell carbonic anhydrase